MSWRERAACLGSDPNIFFPERGGSNSEARRICASCPVIADCLDYALRTAAAGFWAGTTQSERIRMRKRLGVQLERKWRVDL